MRSDSRNAQLGTRMYAADSIGNNHRDGEEKSASLRGQGPPHIGRRFRTRSIHYSKCIQLAGASNPGLPRCSDPRNCLDSKIIGRGTVV